MSGYALDTNIVSFRMKDHQAVVRRLDQANANEWDVQIPPFAYYELRRGLLMAKASARLRHLAKLCVEYPVGKNDDRVFEEAAVIWADLTSRGWNIDEMDIFIAAWCRVNDFTLVTNNSGNEVAEPISRGSPACGWRTGPCDPAAGAAAPGSVHARGPGRVPPPPPGNAGRSRGPPRGASTGASGRRRTGRARRVGACWGRGADGAAAS